MIIPKRRCGADPWSGYTLFFFLSLFIYTTINTHNFQLQFPSGHQVIDFQFIGAVREYSDESLYTYTPEARLSKSPFHIMCQEWKERLEMLRRRRERGTTEQDKKDYKKALLRCLDEGAESVDCASRLLTCVQGFYDAPGLVGGPVSGTLMDVLSGHRCRRTWCSSAKRENFNYFSLSCFCYLTQITRISLVSLTQYRARLSLENQRSNAHSIVTKTRTPTLEHRYGRKTRS